MEGSSIVGNIHSLQSLGTVDGPGIRYVVFTQGCNLRCGCCHNPDTWDVKGGTQYTPSEILEKIKRYKTYFGKDGGITVSGGEPLLQSEFVTELFRVAKEDGINTCLDTSGSILNDSVRKLLSYTDRVLLDIKYTTDEMYREYVGCSLESPLRFLDYLDECKIPVTLRQVIIPGLNDNDENIIKLKEIADAHACVDKVELLPFKKVCKVKYDNMGLEFHFEKYPVPDNDTMIKLNILLNT
ncbi:MAG: pyruvate formate lyase-activating protein [Ruminococcus sp.]|nr:pyruvate formate lyase-activating protein [Ruminococcus sp.]